MIKIIFSILLIIITIINTYADGYKIEAKINGITDSICILGFHYGKNKRVYDTAKVANSTVIFAGEKAIDGGLYFLYTPNGNVYFDIIIGEDQKFSIETDTADFVQNMKVTGSIENKMLYEYQLFLKEKKDASGALRKQLSKIKDNPKEKEKIEEQIEKIDKEVKDYQTDILKKHPETFFAQMLYLMQSPEPVDKLKDKNGKLIDSLWHKYYKNHYFDNINFADSRIVHTPFYYNKIIFYLENLTPPIPDSINKSCDYIINNSRADSTVFRYTLSNIMYHYENKKIMGLDAVTVHLAQKYYLTYEAYWVDSAQYAKIERRVKAMAPTLIGKKAPEIIIRDSLDGLVSTHTYDVKYTILFFYDPECGHCNKMTQNLLSVYDTIMQYDAEIIGINTTTDKEKWQKYLKKYDIPWVSLIDPYVESYFRSQYDLLVTPIIYIINAEKTIIAKKIGAKQIPGFLENYEKYHSKK